MHAVGISGAVALLLAVTVAPAATPVLPAAPAAVRAPAVESANWSGYLANGGAGSSTYIAVSGTFTQPAVGPRCQPASDLLTWVGLGGFNRSAGHQTLIQVGTDADYDIAGGVLYWAWYQYLVTDVYGNQLLGTEKTSLPVDVRPGDVIALSMSVHNGAGTAAFEVRNATMGARASLVEPVPGEFYDGSTADFVAERTAGVGLARFGQVRWTQTTVQRADGTWRDLAGEAGLTEIRMTSGTSTLAAPDPMASPTEFTTRWRACR